MKEAAEQAQGTSVFDIQTEKGRVDTQNQFKTYPKECTNQHLHLVKPWYLIVRAAVVQRRTNHRRDVSGASRRLRMSILKHELALALSLSYVFVLSFNDMSHSAHVCRYESGYQRRHSSLQIHFRPRWFIGGTFFQELSFSKVASPRGLPAGRDPIRAPKLCRTEPQTRSTSCISAIQEGLNGHPPAAVRNLF